jgi:hypothetical protein
MDEIYLNTLLTAVRYGGCFIAKLAEAGLVADPVNRKRLFNCFPQLLLDYGPVSELYRTDLG